MAIIPINEESQAQIETRRQDEKMVQLQGGFKLDTQTILIILDVLLILFFLTAWQPDKAIALPFNIRLSPFTILPILTIVFIALIINKTIVNFMEYERGVVFRWGRFNRIAGPGWEVVFPLLERYVKVDMRLEVISPGIHEVVTKDKVKFIVAPEIFLYVSNPKDAVLNIQNYKKAVIQYVNSALTHTLGDSTSDYIVAHMNEISDTLGHSVEHMTESPGKEWGVVVPRVKLAFIKFPDEVQSAMHKKVASEQLKLAAHEKAEAIKVEIDAIREAGGKLTDPALTYMYLESLDKVARGKATKIVLPLEITRMAEGMAKRSGNVLGLGGDGGIPQDIIKKYTEIVDNYEKRINQIENKIDAGEKKDQLLEDKRLEKQAEEKADRSSKLERRNTIIESNKRIREEYKSQQPTPKEERKEPAISKTSGSTNKELDDYKEKIKEIKKRIGIE
jgi:regulator of protease activity HflC (stomatin/prohibitin superfamily)